MMRLGAALGLLVALSLPLAAEESAPIQSSSLSKVPKQNHTVVAAYPPEAQAKRIEADVTLLLDLDVDGNVTHVEVQKPAAPAGYGFEEAAAAAAIQFHFEPAEIDGKPIAVQVPYIYRFRLLPLSPSPTEGDAGAPSDGGTSPSMTAPELEGAGLAPPPPMAPPPPHRDPVINFDGQLVERGTRAPRAGMLVTAFREAVGGEGFEATTDAEGRFAFYDLAPGPWRVLIESPGYYPYRTVEQVVAGQRTTVKYYIERGAYNAFDVTVTAEAPRKEVNRTILPSAVIEKVPGTAGDPLNVVASLPGVARTPLAGGEIVVRGAAPEDTQILVNGTVVPNIYHFGGLRSVIPVGMLEGIDFQPGSFNSYYGRAIGGIIDVRIKKLNPPRLGGYVDVSLLDAGLYLEAPIGPKAAVAVAARRSYIDVLLGSGNAEDTGVNLVTAPVYYDYQLVANYRPAPAHDLRLMVFGSDDRLAILFTKPGDLSLQSTSNRFNQKQSFYRSLLEYRYVPASKLENSFQAAIGRDVADFSLGSVVFNVSTDTVHVRDTLRWKAARYLTAVAGIDFLYQRWNGLARLPAIPKEGAPPGNPDFGQLVETRVDSVGTWSPGWYGELELTPIDRLFISAGVRADYFSRISQSTWAPRLIARYGVLPTLTLKGGTGLYYQEPQFDETDPNFGNPRVKAERAAHVSVGLEWKPLPYFTLDGTAFYKDLSNMISATDATVNDNGVTRPLRFDNGGVGRVKGFELMARSQFTNRFAGWVAYTLSRSERRDSGVPDYRLFDFDQTHILAAVASYQLPGNWQVGGRFRYVTGTPQTPVVGSIFNSLSDQYDPIYGAPNSARTPAFSQLDIRVDKKWIHRGWTSTMYVDLQNVYNRANPEGFSYNHDFTQKGITRGLPVLTIVGFKAEL
ncbi:MAG: TonB family protein [Myxococcales bacterium]